MKNRASENELASLHGIFAEVLAAKLKSGEVSSSELSVIRQFLKDNGIDCVGSVSPDMNSIVDGLKDYSNVTGEDDEDDRILM